MAWLILGTAALRVAFAAATGLGIDESYMVVAGRGPLQLGYFDHPLLSWWMARLVADATGSEAAVLVRLPFIAIFAVSTWMMSKLAPTPQAGLWAAVAFNLAPVFGVTAAAWVLPDGPLICALLGMALCLMRALPSRVWHWWIGAGLCAGLAMLSKYTAVLSIAGFGIYLLTDRTHRKWLLRPQPYAAAVIAAIVFLPAVIWNQQNNWASIAFQGGRASATRIQPLGPIVTLAGEALFLLPWIWAGLMLALWRGLQGEWRAKLLCWIALPPIVLFAVVSLWSRQVLFHWAAPGYLMLFPLLGSWLAERQWAPRAALATAALVATVLIATAGEISFGWLPNNPLLQARTWSELRPALLKYNLPIAAASWSDTGKVGIGLGPNIPVFCLNVDARQFRFTTPPPTSGDLVIVAPRQTLAQMQTYYAANFAAIEALPPVRVGNSEIAVFKGRGLIAWPR